MARARISLGTHPLRDDPGRSCLSAQPDLSVGRTLCHAIRHLDGAAKRGLAHYADAWLAEAEDIGLMIEARCRPDGAWSLGSSQIADGQEVERRRRESALAEHMHAVEGAYDQIVSLSRRRGCYSDDREIDTRHLVSIVRDFITTGGHLFVNSHGHPGLSPDDQLLARPMPCDGERHHAHLIAFREAVGLSRRWHSHKRLARIARMLGTPTASGSHVFQRKAAAPVAEMVTA